MTQQCKKLFLINGDPPFPAYPTDAESSAELELCSCHLRGQYERTRKAKGGGKGKSPAAEVQSMLEGELVTTARLINSPTYLLLS